MDKLHYIDSRGGRIGGRADTSPADVDAIVAALQQDSRRHLVLHFHGGLVSKEAGLDIAARLAPIYSPSAGSGGYPVFYVWESGAWETIRNNLTELADEPVFKQLLRKILQYALEQLGAQDPSGVGRSIPQATFGSRALEVDAEIAVFLATPSKGTIPFRGFGAMVTNAQARSASLAISEDEIVADLEQDAALRRSLATLPDVPVSVRSALADSDVVERRSSFSEIASHEFSKESASRGLVELYQVAKYLARVLRGVLHRYSAGRDHGLYATCVEELVRGFKLAGSGLNDWGKALQWNRMKQDTAEAFDPDPNVHAGTALLARLQIAVAQGLQLDRLTLVGHSTGAIYIAHWLENSVRYLPAALKQDVIFLAPAITYDYFAHTLRVVNSQLGSFRMFAMKDVFERDDQVWGEDGDLPGGRDWRRFIYPSSLLYLVSGILESRLSDDRWIDEPDMPILGMERFFLNEEVYANVDFPSIREVRMWLTARTASLTWSKRTGASMGFNSECIDHGSFDDDESTLQSVRHIVEHGF